MSPYGIMQTKNLEQLNYFKFKQSVKFTMKVTVST